MYKIKIMQWNFERFIRATNKNHEEWFIICPGFWKTEAMVADLQNYDEIYHKHTKKYTNIDIDCVCRFLKHTDNCRFDKPQMLKRNHRIHLKEVVN